MSETKDVQNQELERLKIKLGFIKFLIGTIAISLLSIIINWQIQEKRLQFQIQSKESDYIARFLEHGLDKELENRRDFAAYFVRLSPSEEARGRWEHYLDFTENLIQQAKKAEKIILEKDAELKIAIEKAVLAEKKEQETREELKKLSGSSAVNKKILEKQISKLSNERKKSKELLQTLQENIEKSQQDLASIRSKPINIISADNIAKKSKKKDGFWDWKIFLKASNSLLEKIEYVEYTLHSSFDDPIKIVNKRGGGQYAFAYNASGWGEFTVRVKIYYEDGSQQRLSHFLNFGE